MGLYNKDKKLSNFVPWRSRPGTMFLHRVQPRTAAIRELTTRNQPLDLQNQTADLFSFGVVFDTHQIVPTLVEIGGDAQLVSDERIYNGGRLTTLSNPVLSYRATIDGALKEFYLWTAVNNSPISAEFTIIVNGSDVLTTPPKLIIAQGSGFSSKLNMDVPVELGDLVELNIEVLPELGVFGPIILLVKTLPS